MDFSKSAKDKITVAYFQWLGFENKNGALVKEGIGEIQFYNENFWFCQDNKAVKKIELNEDIDSILIQKQPL